MNTADVAGDQVGGSRADGQSPEDAWTVMQRFYAAEAVAEL
ncbi:hypothetical protein [Microtetraspora malaysiensis]|nr:hypothetical protein [Microtetraspora malaysiensis]